MKKILILLIVIISSIGCSEESNFIITDEFASFGRETYNLQVLRNSMETQSIIVTASTISKVDRTYAIEIDEENSNITASSYTIPNSITIPANSLTANFNFEIADDLNLEGETLVLELVADTFSKSVVTLNIDLLCPSVPPVEGTWQLQTRDLFDFWEGATVAIELDGTTTIYDNPSTSTDYDVIVPPGTSEMRIVFNGNGEFYTSDISFKLLKPNGEVAIEVIYNDNNIGESDETNYCKF